jgi:hypothetical protein
MFGFVVALAVGVIAFCVTADLVYKPKVNEIAHPETVTIDDVWRSLASAQQTLDESRMLIYGE